MREQHRQSLAAKARARTTQIKLIQRHFRIADYCDAQSRWSALKRAGELEATMSEIENSPPPPPEDHSRCPKCGGRLVEKLSSFGPFLGCQRYPECDGRRKLPSGHGAPGPSEEDTRRITDRVQVVAEFVRAVGGISAAEKLVALYRQLSET